MGFESLWEKYGETENIQCDNLQEEIIVKKNHVSQNDILQRNEEKQIDKKQDVLESDLSIHNISNNYTNTKNEMPGIFGDDEEGGYGGEHSKKKNISHQKSFFGIDFSGLSNLPWIDIIFGFITIAMVISVIINFESVTTAIFQMLLPLLCNIVTFAFIFGLIVFVIWWLTRRRWRRW